jgi:hypothetical protein
VNTRPGLQIQLANLAGLTERIERVRDLRSTSEVRRARLAQDLFGESGEELDEIYRRKVLGTTEEVEIIPSLSGSYSQLSNYKTLAKIDTGAWRTSISLDIAKELGIQQFQAEKNVKSSLGEKTRPITPLVFILGDQKIETKVYVADRSSMKYEMIVGRRDLKNFIINPSKTHKF